MLALLKDKVSIVTGANRGIGLELCRQLARNGAVVVLTSRDEEKGLAACAALDREKLPVRYHQLDIDYAASISQMRAFIEKEFGRCDILINNAGIFPDVLTVDQERVPSILNVSLEKIKQAMHTNALGPLQMCQAFVPAMVKNNYGRIVNISSRMGQLSEMNGGYPGYRVSKTALNALTRILSDELQGNNILVNSMCPGWVLTDMGGPNATRSVQEGADTAVWLASLPDNGPRGKFFRDRKEIRW